MVRVFNYVGLIHESPNMFVKVVKLFAESLANEMRRQGLIRVLVPVDLLKVILLAFGLSVRTIERRYALPFNHLG